MIKQTKRCPWSVIINGKYYPVGNRKEAEYVIENVYKIRKIKYPNSGLIIGIERTSKCVKMYRNNTLKIGWKMYQFEDLNLIL